MLLSQSKFDIKILNVSLDTIIVDLTKQIYEDVSKKSKLLKRLHFILNNVPEMYLHSVDFTIKMNAVICYNKFAGTIDNVESPDLLELLKERKLKSQLFNYAPLQTGDILVKPLGGTLNETLKKGMERILTDAFVKNSDTYTKTCGLFNDVITGLNNYLDNDTKKSAQIFARRKGSMSTKTTLKFMCPDIVDKIDECFSNSDNDTTINIHPDTPEFDKVFNTVSDFVFEYLRNWDDKGLFDAEITEISNTKFAFKPVFKPAFVFDYEREYRMSMDSTVFNILEEKKFRITRNFVKIPRDTHVEMFELIRVKIGFEVEGIMFYAELLDIVIPYKNAKSLQTDIKFKNSFVEVLY